MNYKINNPICQLERQQYIDISKNKVQKTEEYLENKCVFNRRTGELIEMKYDFYKKERDTYLYHAFNSMLLEKQMRAEGKVAFFITVTLSGQYHKYKIKDHKEAKNRKDSIDLELNPTHNADLTINDGYQVLNDSFRYLYKKFRKYNPETKKQEHLKIHFQKVIEPHKNQTAHLHALVFIDENNIQEFYKQMNRMKQKFSLGRIETEKIKKSNRASAYILKYIKKTFSGVDKDLSHYIHGWRTENRIRNYTSSQVLLPRYIYGRLSRNLGSKLQDITKLDDKTIYKMKEKYLGENYLELLSNMCDITVKTVEDGKEVEKLTKTLGSSVGEFEVQIAKEKLFRPVLKKEERIKYTYTDLISDPMGEIITDFFIEDEAFYKIIHFKIIRKKDKKIIYDKNDYQFIKNKFAYEMKNSA